MTNYVNCEGCGNIKAFCDCEFAGTYIKADACKRCDQRYDKCKCGPDRDKWNRNKDYQCCKKCGADTDECAWPCDCEGSPLNLKESNQMIKSDTVTVADDVKACNLPYPNPNYSPFWFPADNSNKPEISFEKNTTPHRDPKKSKGLNKLRDKCFNVAASKGWHDSEVDVDFGTRIALIHSELSEALEEYRDGCDYNEVYYKDGKEKPEGIPVELADILIRILDLCGKYDIDIQKAVKIKMKYNKTRPYRHGGKKI